MVTKLKGSTNELTVTVTETHVDGSESSVTSTFTIDSNSAGTYAVGEYDVYVDTKGNTQVREIHLVP